MGSLIVGPSEQAPDSLDIGEVLRRKRIRDILAQARESSVDPAAPSGIDPVTGPPQVAPQVAPRLTPAPVSNPTLYQTPESTQDLRRTIQSAPDINNYKPSWLSKISGAFGNVGRTIETGDPAQGIKAQNDIQYAPFNRQMGIYQQKVQQAKAVSDIDQAIQEGQQKGQMQEATIGHLNAQGLAEAERAKAETARRIHEEAETKILPPDWETKRKFDLEKEKIAHPEKGDTYQAEIDKDRGIAIITNKGTGEVYTASYGDGKDATEKLTGELAQLAAAEKILSDPKETPERKAAAQELKTEFKGRNQQKPPQALMFVPQDGGGYRAQTVSGGQSIPAGTLGAGGINTEQVNQDKSIEAERKAKKAAQDTAATAERLVNQAEKAKDPSEAATADAALVMQLAGAIKPDALGKLRWNQSEQDFLIKKTRAAGGDFEALASKVTGGEHVILTSAQRRAFLQTIKTVAGGPETLQASPETNTKDPLGILGGK